MGTNIKKIDWNKIGLAIYSYVVILLGIYGEYMNWCSIDETYVNYLKSYESRIPYSDYGVNHFKPFFRPLFEIEPGIIFVGAISHPQDRHRKMKNKPDFRKIFID